jgi:hypothetical protein
MTPDDYVRGPGEWVATSDDYGNHHAGGYATVEEFFAMCDSCFGERPVLTHRRKGTDDVCVDADDRVVLLWVPAEPPADADDGA